MTDVSKGSKSIADLILAVLDDWGKIARLLILTSSLCAVAYGLVWLILRSTPSNTSELQIGTAHILFSQSTSEGQKYLVVVPPQGWQRTGIHVPDGANLSIESDGRVEVDLRGLNEALKAEVIAEQRVRAARARGELGRNVTDDAFFPEAYFTKEEREAVRPRWSWVGPDGFSKDEMRSADPARQNQIMLRGPGYGALIASLSDTNVDPLADRTVSSLLAPEAFFVGRSLQKVARKGGYLYFAVNDVQSSNKDFPDEFLNDNVGLFYAKVNIVAK